jgi:penicillin-binding protein 1A
VVYATAIRKGIHPCSQISNRLVTYPQFENWQPKNSDGKYGGYYSMEGALSKSINAITVNLVMRTGSKPVVELAKQMGITTEIPAVPSIALGAAEVSLFDMIRVYGTFANRGKNVTPVYIAKIVDRNGHVLRKHDEEAATNVKEALTEDEADMMNKMLQSTINTGTGVRLRYRYNFTTPLAGKTGTSQNHSDGWFIGYTPSLVGGAWVGAESPAVYFRDLNLGQGANTALPIFAEFWKQLLEEEQYDRYTKEIFPELSLKAKSMMNCSTFAKSDSLYQQNRAKAVENARAVEVGMNEVKSSPKLVSGETFMQ